MTVTADDYFMHGFATFPVYLSVGPDGKTRKLPTIVAWQSLTTLNQPNHNSKNYGVNLTDDILVIDVDMSGDKVGAQSFARLQSEHPQLDTSTYTVVSGRGGLHYYYRKPPLFDLVKVLNKRYPDIEFLTKGSYVVGPGTHFDHPDFKPYEARRTLDDILPVPDSLLTMLSKVRYQKSRQTDPDYHDDEATRHQYRLYLQRAPIAVQGAQGDLTTYKVAAYGRDLGLTEDANFAAMWAVYNERCSPSWSYDELANKVRNVYNYALGEVGHRNYSNYFQPMSDQERADMNHAREFSNNSLRMVVGKNGRPKDNDMSNLVVVLNTPDCGSYCNPLYGLFRYNLFAHRVEFAFSPPWERNDPSQSGVLTDDGVRSLIFHLAQTQEFNVRKEIVWDAVQLVAQQNPYHPIRSYLHTLKWDGKCRLSDWLTRVTGCKDTPYSRLVSRKVMLAIVARVMRPGCKFDHVMVLEGHQGIGKGRLIRAMAWKDDYYSSQQLDVHGKETPIAINNKWVVELPELSSLPRRDLEGVKDFITKQEDVYRPPYDRTSKTFPRQCVFIGTVNPDGDGYLTDSTGNRRWWPIECKGHIDVEWFVEQREQLYAEAMHQWNEGEQLYLTVQESLHAEYEQDKRLTIDEWVYAVGDWLDNQPSLTQVTFADVALGALGITISGLGGAQRKRIANALQLNGWTRLNKSDWKKQKLTGDVNPILLKSRCQELLSLHGELSIPVLVASLGLTDGRCKPGLRRYIAREMPNLIEVDNGLFKETLE